MQQMNQTIYNKLVRNQDDIIDHIDGNTINTKINNLREASYSENNRNRINHITGSKTGKRGVCHTKNDKFVAKISYNGKMKHLGIFNTVEEASFIYQSAVLLYHGEFSKMNQSEYRDVFENLEAFKISEIERENKNAAKVFSDLPKGVQMKGNSYCVQIGFNSKKIYLGSFDKLENAHELSKKAFIIRQQFPNILEEDFFDKLGIIGKKPKGYRFSKSTNNYQARIGYGGKEIYLGTFKTAEEASQAYLDAVPIIHGDFSDEYKDNYIRSIKNNKKVAKLPPVS
jgi:hypothetical protein